MFLEAIKEMKIGQAMIVGEGYVGHELGATFHKALRNAEKPIK